MSRILHKAYGLSIGTDLLLPELSSLSPDAVDDVDVDIREMALGGSRVLWGVAADGSFSLGLQNLLVVADSRCRHLAGQSLVVA